MSRKHKRVRPDVKSSHLAGAQERERARKVYEQQHKEAETMQTQTEPVPAPRARKSRQGNQLTAEQMQWLNSLVSREGADSIVGWLEGLPRARTVQCGPRQWARASLRGILKPGATHHADGLAVFYELRNNYGRPHHATDPQIRVVTQERPSPGYDTAEDALDALLRTPSVIEFNGRAIRLVFQKGGGFGFVAKDVVEAVGAKWHHTAIDHIPDEYKGSEPITTPGGLQSVTILTEAGVNMYLFRSDKPAALPWQKHLAEEVLPSIRKTGRYEQSGRAPALPQAVAPQIDVQTIATVVATAVGQAMIPVMQTVKSGLDELVSRRRPRAENRDQDSLNLQGKVPARVVERELDRATERKVLSAMIKRLAGVNRDMPSVEYGARMSVVYEQIRAELLKLGHDMTEDMAAADKHGERINSLDYFEATGIIGQVMRIVSRLHEAKIGAKAAE